MEIGATLKESIPKKYEHLIDNLPVNDHKEMMRKLTSKFGDCKHNVDKILSKISIMKTVDTDKKFIDFVDVIDKIHRYLVELNVEDKIALTNMVSEIEKKLQNCVGQDWADVYMEEDK